MRRKALESQGEVHDCSVAKVGIIDWAAARLNQSDWKSWYLEENGCLTLHNNFESKTTHMFEGWKVTLIMTQVIQTFSTTSFWCTLILKLSTSLHIKGSKLNTKAKANYPPVYLTLYPSTCVWRTRHSHIWCVVWPPRGEVWRWHMMSPFTSFCLHLYFILCWQNKLLRDGAVDTAGQRLVWSVPSKEQQPMVSFTCKLFINVHFAWWWDTGLHPSASSPGTSVSGISVIATLSDFAFLFTAALQIQGYVDLWQPQVVLRT